MKDGQIVWQAQCQHCGWKDPQMSVDIEEVKARAAQHLQACPDAAAPVSQPEEIASGLPVLDLEDADVPPLQLGPMWDGNLEEEP